MGSPLGRILAGVFIVKLENMLVPKLKQHIKNWRRYVDDTFLYVKNSSIEYVWSVLETFHSNIKFTYEKEVITHCHFYIFCLLGTQITFRQLHIEKKPKMIYTYIGMYLRLYLGNVQHSELWLIELILSAANAYFMLRMANHCR